MSSPAFQRWAASSLLTRAITRRRARAVFDLCAGFVYSQILHACVELRLLERLARGPATLDQLSRELDLAPDRARRLLEGATALGLLARRGVDRYGLGMDGAAMLANPGILRMIEHHAMLYRDLADPVALLRDKPRSRELARYWGYATSDAPQSLDPADVERYTRLMSASQTFVADEVLDAYPLSAHRALLDVGGGDGTFLRRVAARASHLELHLFDLPAVAAIAERGLAESGLSHRAKVHPGSFITDPLPQGADVVTLVRVLHDHDDDIALILLSRARAALDKGGVLLIAEPMSGTAGAETVGEAYFGFYLLAMGSGRPRRPDEIFALLREAGFARFRMLPTRLALQTSLVLAEV
ncbi:MAG: methyltransferase [Hyphomicrobium sp.]|nr:methyltransferase [Hyphomicrobium sp.]